MPTREIKTTIAIDGEKKFKSALDEAQRSLRVMQAELKAETAAFDANTTAQQRAQTRASSLRSQIEQQKKVVEALRGAVADSAAKWGENSKQTDGYRIKLANAQKTLNEMTRDLGEAEKASDGLNRSMAQTTAQMGATFKSTLSAAGDIATTVSAAGVAAFGAVTAAAGTAAKQVATLTEAASVKADDLLTLSAQTGIDTTTLQQWQYASRFIDTEVGSITDSIKKLRQNMQKSDKDTGLNDALVKLGVKAKDGAGRYRDAVDVFWDVIDAAHTNLSGLNETELDTLLQTLTGKGYTDLLPLIQAGRQAWEQAMAEATAGGLVLDKKTLDDLGAYNDKLQEIDAAWEGIKTSMGAIALQYAQPIATGVADIATAFNRLLRGEEGAGEDLATSVDTLFTSAETSLRTGWANFNAAIDELNGSDNESAQKLGGALGSLRDGLTDIYENRDGYIAALEALFAVMVGTKAVNAATKIWQLGKSVADLIAGMKTLGLLSPEVATVGAAGAIVAYGASHPERSALQPEYYEATTGTSSDIENLKAWIAAQNAANAATYDPDTSPEAIEAARLLNEAAQAAKDALLATEGGRDLNERYAAYLATVDGYDGTVMPDIPPEWAEQIEGQMQSALDGTSTTIDPRLTGSWAESTRATMQGTLNGMGLTVNVTPTISGAAGSLITGTAGTAASGRWISQVVDGSHADGLYSVPRDNYLALLHKGERVLTAADAARDRAGVRWEAASAAQAGGGLTLRQVADVMAQVLSGVRVQISGEDAGRLLAPWVSEEMARGMA